MADCDTCNALCCKYFCLEIDQPDTIEEYENIRWYLLHEGTSVHIDEEDDWYLQIYNPCKMLDGNRCSIYDNRPLICRNYGETCEITGGEYDYKEIFQTPEELEAYVRRTLGDEKYEKKLLKHYAKAEKVSLKEMTHRLMLHGRIQSPEAAVRLVRKDAAKKDKQRKNNKARKAKS